LAYSGNYQVNGSEDYMPRGYKTVNVNDNLYEGLSNLAIKVAKKEGLSKVSLAQLIERMKKRYEDTENGLE
jgi:hypothetical protein